MILDALLLIPILAAVAIGLGAPARQTATFGALGLVLLTIVAALNFKAGQPGYFLQNSAPVVLTAPEIRLGLGLDGLSLTMLILTALVTLTAVAGSPIEPGKGSIRLYYASILLIAAGCIGAFLATDLFFFYAFHELALIPTFLMIGIFGSGDRKGAAWKITIYLGVGSLILLAGLAALFLGLGGKTFSLAELALAAQSGGLDPENQARIFLTLVIGFGILISLFPFHSWAPSAYASAPTPVAMMHAGVLKKFGLYGLIRVALPLLPEGSQTQWVLNLLLILLLGNILWIGLETIAQKDLDLMLGHSSVMHMGYIFLGIASWNAIGLGGAAILMLAHGLSIALLFLLNGALREKAGTVSFERLGGLAKKAPMLGLLFGMAAFASVGLPGFANFAGEVLVFFGAFKNTVAHGTLWLGTATVLALWGVVISAVYMLRAYRAVFKGEIGATTEFTDIDCRVKWPAIILVVALLIVGFCPNLILSLVQPVFAVLGK